MDENRIAAYSQTSPEVYLLTKMIEKLGVIEQLLTMILDVREKPVEIKETTITNEFTESEKAKPARPRKKG